MRRRTITISELQATETWSVKDDSARGCTTKCKNEIKIGDKVVLENRFVLVTEEIEKMINESKGERIKARQKRKEEQK